MTTETDKPGDGDVLLAKMETLINKHLGPVNTRLDAMEAGTKLRADAATTRHDAERDAWMKADAAACAEEDALEEAEKAAMVGAGDPEETAMDKARVARRDRMTKRRADAVRGRSAANAMAERKNEGERADAQARADAAAVAFGETAPPPMSGERSIDYRKRLLRRFQNYSPDFKNVDLHTIADATLLSGIETRIYADAVKASTTATLPDVLTYVTRAGEGGHMITEARGKHTSITDLKRDSMRVTKFNVPTHGAA